jgi:hypothetical protein
MMKAQERFMAMLSEAKERKEREAQERVDKE